MNIESTNVSITDEARNGWSAICYTLFFIHLSKYQLLMDIRIENKDYLEFLATIPNGSIDFVCIDPPYNVLTKHKIETKINIPLLTKEVNRILKPNSFYSIFGQMPTIIEWHNEITKDFNFKQDIVWAKRQNSSPYQKILRTKEYVYIYSNGDTDYFDTKAPYEDVKIPLIPLGLYDIDSFYRHALARKSGKGLIVNKRKSCNDEIYNNNQTISNRSPEFINICDVWSFTPENKTERNSNNIKHPTVKPIKLLERLIKLCTPENATVLDCFLGSGTTAIACKNTNRNFIGCELYEDYYQIALERLANTQPLLFHSI